VDGHPWNTRVLRHGGINQAGIPMAFGTAWDDTRGYMTRAVVLKTYYSDDSEWDSRAWAKGNTRGVYCDVRTYGRYSRPLWKVPVLQRAHGMHDEDIYVPRDSSQDLAGKGKLVTLPSGKTGPKPTPAENLDGDHVLVGFLEGNPDSPVILPFCLPHPSSARRLTEDAGRVKRFRHSGVVIEWSEDGNLTIDASGAAKEKLGSSGAEQSNSGTGGTITVKTKDGAGAESSLVLDSQGGVKIIDGAGDFIAWTKAAQKVEVVAGATYSRSAPVQTISGTSRTTTLTTDTLNAGASVTVNAPSITLGLAAPLPLVKYPGVAAAMASLLLAINAWIAKYDPSKNPSAPTSFTQAALADWVTLNNAWATALQIWASPATPTVITKAG
jgi:hypothetical protein